MKKLLLSLQFMILASILLIGFTARAAGPVLKVERTDASEYPKLKAYVSVIGGNGMPLAGLSKDNFKVYENKTNAVDAAKVQTLDSSGYGAAIAIVLQTSGSMSPVLEDMKKAATAYVSSLGEKDQVALVVYSDKVETLAPLGDKSNAASGILKIENTGLQKLLFDGVGSALSLFASPGLPQARAIVVLGDGGDTGSASDIEKLITESKKKRIPIFAVGHSETGGTELDIIKDLATRATGYPAYADAPDPGDLSKGFIRVQQYISKQYVVEWVADAIESDAQTYKLEVGVEVGGAKLKGDGEITTPLIKSYKKLIIISVIVLLVLIAVGAFIWWKTRPPPPEPVILCPVCNREQMKDWDTCLFCLKNCAAKLVGTRGPTQNRQFPLVGKMVKLGRGPENAIKILDPSVSTNHCIIQIDGTKFEIVDNRSANGTFVNGKRIERRGVANGDTITLGQVEFRFESSIVDASSGDYSE